MHIKGESTHCVGLYQRLDETSHGEGDLYIEIHCTGWSGGKEFKRCKIILI